METLFKEKGLRVTQFRKTVYGIFEKNQTAISVGFIENELQNFDRITLYRTLRIFKEKGVIHEITFPNKEKRLALCPQECSHKNEIHNHDHIHFHCNDCKEVYCVDIPNFPKLSLSKYKVDKIEIQAIGKCEKCA
ncbi:MAG: Fur family transcriptional regulator [Crocinitomicaceae bacterium]